MAYDKLVDSTQLDADLTAIANAIREKAGVSDNFTFPAGFAEAIAAIEAGGGNGPFTTWGTYTPTEDMDRVDVEIDLGIAYSNASFAEDRLFLLWRNGSYNRVNGSYEVLLHRSSSAGYTYSYGTKPGGSVFDTNSEIYGMRAKVEVKDRGLVAIVSGGTTASSVYGLKAGVEYIWGFVYPIGVT